MDRTNLERQGCLHGFHPIGLQGIPSPVHELSGRARADRSRAELSLSLCHRTSRKRNRGIYPIEKTLPYQQRHPPEIRHRRARNQPWDIHPKTDEKTLKESITPVERISRLRNLYKLRKRLLFDAFAAMSNY